MIDSKPALAAARSKEGLVFCLFQLENHLGNSNLERSIKLSTRRCSLLSTICFNEHTFHARNNSHCNLCVLSVPDCRHLSTAGRMDVQRLNSSWGRQFCSFDHVTIKARRVRNKTMTGLCMGWCSCSVVFKPSHISRAPCHRVCVCLSHARRSSA